MTDSEDAEFTGTTLAVGQTITVHVKQLFDVSNVGSKSDVLTIAADDQATKTINLTGTTRDGSILYVDFDDPNAFPEGWQAGANWNVYTYGTDRYAYQSSSKTPSALVTTPLTVEDGQKLSFKVARNSSGYGYTTLLKTRYSQNGGTTWSEYTEHYNSDNAGSAYTTIDIEDLPTGNILVEFFGNNIKLDMIQGVKTATAPALTLIESSAAVENGSTKDLGNLNADATVIYTLKNTGNDVLRSTITGEGVTVSPASAELAAGETAEVTVTMAFGAPYGDKTGTMTITSEGWVGDMVVNYAATLVDPTDFVEDFTAGKPAGWYSEGWTFSTVNGNAYVYTGVNKLMITEQIGAESGKNVLTFDAKVYTGEDEQTLTVYTSTDRKNWTEAKVVTLTSDVQNVALDALADGNYYVKFEARNAVVDNIKGVKKLEAPEHDLYITTATLPTGTPYVETEIATSATVTSLRADETGVYATLFVDGVEVATADAADIIAYGTKTFSMSYTTPSEAGSHTAYIEVYYSNDAVAFTTLPSAFEVKDYPTLVLNEAETLEAEAGKYSSVTLNRPFIAGWNTLVLPFDAQVSKFEGATFYELSSNNAGELTFSKLSGSTIAAGTPYLVNFEAAVTDPIAFTNVELSTNTVDVAQGDVTFKGNYVNGFSMSGRYGVTPAGKVQKGASTSKMKAYRAYLEGEGVLSIRIYDPTTGIDRTLHAEEVGAVYNLQGQRINGDQRGVVIVGGKKILR